MAVSGTDNIGSTLINSMDVGSGVNISELAESLAQAETAAMISSKTKRNTRTKKRNTKILTAEFKPGDALIFGMYTVHGTFENHAKDNKIRLTCDIRFQPKNEPKDL